MQEMYGNANTPNKIGKRDVNQIQKCQAPSSSNYFGASSYHLAKEQPQAKPAPSATITTNTTTTTTDAIATMRLPVARGFEYMSAFAQ